MAEPIPKKQEFNTDINELLRRLRVLEERYSNLRRKHHITEQNMINDSNRIQDDIKVIRSVVNDIKNEVQEVNNKMQKLSDEVQGAVPKRDLNLLSKYLEFWEPMEFMRKDEAETTIREIIDRIKSE